MMITTKQLLHGFLRNYGNLQFGIDGTHTSWTFKSMDYFNRLGRLLGYWVEFEGHRYDQTWYKFIGESKDYDPDKLFLHLEHENEASRVNETIEKLIGHSDKAKAKKRIGIVYPDKNLFLTNVNDFKNRTIELTEKNEEVMLIFLGLYQKPDENECWPVKAIRKFHSKTGTKTSEFTFQITQDLNEILYTVFE